jgi:hypothetical protein
MLARLADILLPKGGWFVTFAEVYIDESGSHDDSPILAVGGYLFEKNAAVEFDSAWKQALERWELPYFRMSACAHQKYPFNDKSKDECIEIERSLILLTRDKSPYGFVITVNEQEYNLLGPQHQDIGSAYSFCLRQCLTAVRAWVRQTAFTGKIAYFFEAGHRDQGEAGRIMERVFRESRLREDLSLYRSRFRR